MREEVAQPISGSKVIRSAPSRIIRKTLFQGFSLMDGAYHLLHELLEVERDRQELPLPARAAILAAVRGTR